LKIEKGSIIEWKVSNESIEENETSLYHMSKRSHVIAFNNLNTESPMLKENDTFRVKIHECGHFSYFCQIYTRMKG
jgi:plastocyanin